jgi:hypothetical protein
VSDSIYDRANRMAGICDTPEGKSMAQAGARLGIELSLSDLGIAADEIPWAKRVLEAARAYANHDDCTSCIEAIRMANHGRNARVHDRPL